MCMSAKLSQDGLGVRLAIRKEETKCARCCGWWDLESGVGKCGFQSRPRLWSGAQEVCVQGGECFGEDVCQ